MIQISKKNNKGFTLIELLVVIAIIGLLSSIVLASLNSARLKARDAAVRDGAQQMRSLLELEFSNNGNYNNLEPGWLTDAATCNASFVGVYAQNARDICNSVLKNTGNVANPFYVYQPLGTSAAKYTIMAYLPSKNTYYCAGSNGINSDTENGGWTAPGCYANPTLIAY